MAYKYRVTVFDGAKVGYVDYNITPDIGTDAICQGDTVTIQGQAYNNIGTVKSFSVNLSNRDVAYIPLTISKGSKKTFNISFTVPESFFDKNATSRVSKYFIGFTFWEKSADSEENSGTGTMDNENQYVQILNYRFTPQISNVYIIDRNDKAYNYFNSYIIGQSDFQFYIAGKIDKEYTPSAEIQSITINLNGLEEKKAIYTNITLEADGSFRTYCNYGKIDFSNNISYTIVVLDTKNQSASYSGDFSLVDYFPPNITSFSLERYKEDLDEYDNIIYVPSDTGSKIWLNFNGDVCPINNKNAWKIIIQYEQDESYNYIDKNIASGTDGQNINIENNRDFFLEEIFDAGHEYSFAVTLIDSLANSIQNSFVVRKTGGKFHISKNGVAVGQRSSGTEEQKLFEVAKDHTTKFYGPVEFYGGTIGEGNYENQLGTKTGAKWFNTDYDIYRYTIDSSTPIAIDTWTDVATLSSYFSSIIDFQLSGIRADGLCIPIPNYTSSSNYAGARVQSGVLQVYNHGSSLVRVVGSVNYIKQYDSNFIWRMPRMGVLTGQNITLSCSSTYSSSYPAWKAFNGNLDDYWASSNSATQPHVQIQFPLALSNIKIRLLNRVQGNMASGNVPITGFFTASNDGSTFVEIGSFSNRPTEAYAEWAGDQWTEHNLENSEYYSYLRIVVSEWGKKGSAWTGFNEIEIEGQVNESETEEEF